jgi:hypothetical protein
MGQYKSNYVLDETAIVYAFLPWTNQLYRNQRKMSSSKKNLDFAADVYLSEAPSLLGFCLGWSSNFVGSESGPIQCVKLLQNMVSNRTQHPPPLPATHCLYILYFDTEKGGGGRVEPERRLEGQQFKNLGRKILTFRTVSPIYKL